MDIKEEMAELCKSCGGFTYGFTEAKWCCHCGAKLEGEYFTVADAFKASTVKKELPPLPEGKMPWDD